MYGHGRSVTTLVADMSEWQGELQRKKLLNAENMTDCCDGSAIWNSSSANYSATPKKRRCNDGVSWQQFMKSKDIIPLTRWTSTQVGSSEQFLAALGSSWQLLAALDSSGQL